MTERFLPAGRPVVYTIEQRSTVPVETWNKFTSAIIDIYHSLPCCMRPVNPRRNNEQTGAFSLFHSDSSPNADELVFSGKTGEGYRHRIITVSRERTRDVLGVDEIETEHQMSADLFIRMVMLALHNICAAHFIVHSTAGACSWALPLAILNRARDGQFSGWELPDVAQYATSFSQENARLTEQAIAGSLTLSPGINLSREQWEDIAALEFRLYEPLEPLSDDPEIHPVDIILGSSSGSHELVTLIGLDALLHWVSVNMPDYEDGVPDQEPIFLSRNHLSLLRDDIRNGWFSSYNNDPTYGEIFCTELQLVAVWAEYCIRTLDMERESVFLFASW
ncbi:hypothetical protein AC369_24810 [Salmonella enterica subsp. diarizonae]|nr:hypothetical protein [Salmonella enterica subsp. diarizonae]EJS8538898.1 hypothetical protein [Salmonella enterica]ECI5215107.1 hypothetical protein [Salmonella enterica subsp. diarizonae]EEI3023779.1 hypothetical protein [Salmonella enterica subsp. diarizonae]EJS8565249.1 hypothetical protein [Salmonella enterica]